MTTRRPPPPQRAPGDLRRPVLPMTIELLRVAYSRLEAARGTILNQPPEARDLVVEHRVRKMANQLRNLLMQLER